MTDSRPRYALLVVALVLSACGTTRDGPLKLYQRDTGDIITLNVGEMLEVLLDGDPSTEINWLKPPAGPVNLEQFGETTYERDLESHDADQKLITRFRAIEPGRMRLQLSYRNPGEPAENRNLRITPDRTFEVWVVVKEKKGGS